MSTVRVNLQYKPRPWQDECHRNMKRFNVLVLHRRAGKTEVALMELIDRALKCNLELGMFVYVAPYKVQARAIAWARLKQKVGDLVVHGVCDINESNLSVTFKHNGAIIRLFGGDDPHSLRGLRLDFAVIDEVAQIRAELWTDVIQPALSDRKGGALFIGTPMGINLFSQLYFSARGLPEWHAAKYTVYDTNALDAEEVARMKRDMSEVSFERELLCSFEAAGDDQLISLADVELASKRELPLGSIDYAPKIVGVDPARFGDDRSVIFRRQGLQAFDPQVYRGVDNMELAGYVANVIVSWQPDAVFIDAGNGAGVIDRLRMLGHDVIEIHFGGKAPQSQYLNMRAYMWYEMRNWLKMGAAIPNIVDLKQDLATPIYWFDSAGRIQLEPKDDIKKRGLPSPDLGDALALTFAQPVSPRAMFSASRSAASDYNPYDIPKKSIHTIDPYR